MIKPSDPKTVDALGALARRARCAIAHKAAHVREAIPGTTQTACECKACGDTWIEALDKGGTDVSR